MTAPRIYLPLPLEPGSSVLLDERAKHHTVNVLRLKQGAKLILFNGTGNEYQATLSKAGKQAEVIIEAITESNPESPLTIQLIQGIARGDRMDFAIQKAVELGVKQITPVFTQRSVSKLDEKRQQKRLNHWQGILISACEQSGRCVLPQLDAPTTFNNWLESQSIQDDIVNSFILDPGASFGLNHIQHSNKKISLIIGPEGGFTDEELLTASNKGHQRLYLGPRILRTETAGIAAIAAIQASIGDLSLPL